MIQALVATAVPFMIGGIWLGNIQGDVSSHDKRIAVVEQAPVAIGKLEQNQAYMLAEISRVHSELAATRVLQARTLEEVIAAREKLAAQQDRLERLAK
jgi:hypothetical protein